jgi:translation initiation factor IF-2
VPIRIYALAKELKIDSKELVEICNRAGITGKGSALASLDDDELARVKSFMSGPKTAAPAKTATAEAPPPAESSDAAIYTRDDYIPPASAGKIRMLGAKAKGKLPETADKSERPKVAKLRAPVIHVAQMPDVKKPAPSAKADEPAPQKPDIRLPHDAIASAKLGTRPPLEHLTAKAEKKKKDKDKDKVRPERAAPFEEAAAQTPARTAKSRGRREKTPAGEDIDLTLAGMASARADRQKTRRTRQRARDVSTDERDDDSTAAGRRRLQRRGRGLSTAAPRKGRITLQLPCTVRSFSEQTGVGSGKLLGTLMKLGTMININAQLEREMVDLLAGELGMEIEVKEPTTLEEVVFDEIRNRVDEADTLEARPPVVTFLGHVDHGKTSLLDRLVGTNVVAGEAGGITQHIRAYQVQTPDGRFVSFVDTPGHEAFTEMRARGANVTDIAVLVIAADDGIMPQTEEAISHAQAAEVPIVVALNKMDLPGANANRVMTQLTEHGLTPSEWGGEVEVVQTSAITGDGLDTLLETLLTIADLHEYRANSNRPGQIDRAERLGQSR